MILQFDPIGKITGIRPIIISKFTNMYLLFFLSTSKVTLANARALSLVCQKIVDDFSAILVNCGK
jgi:hypothetical protein